MFCVKGKVPLKQSVNYFCPFAKNSDNTPAKVELSSMIQQRPLLVFLSPSIRQKKCVSAINYVRIVYPICLPLSR